MFSVQSLRTKLTEITMSDFMKQSSDEPTDPFEESDNFQRIHRLRHNSNGEELIEYAENALRYLERNGAGNDTDLRRAGAPQGHHALKEGTWGYDVAPTLATAESVQWNGGFALTEDAPEHGSDEWQEAASDLDIPDGRSYDGVPKAISNAYRHLEDVRDRNEHPRQCHAWELEDNCGIHLPERRYRRVFELLGGLPGVVAPDDSKSVWEHVDAGEATDAESSEVNTHA